jgi:hypothetical protein
MRRTEFTFPISTLAGSHLKNISAVLGMHEPEPKYRPKLILSRAIAGILEPFTLAERLIWQKRIRDYRPETPPVFIIGFWRSGTTLMHNLLCSDPQSAYTTTFQTVFPNIILTQSWWLKPVINFFVPVKRPYDNVSMDMDFPQEEDFGMMNIQPSTIYKFFLFPAEFDKIVSNELFTGDLSPAAISQWKEAYHEMIAKAVFNTGGTRYIGKNPCHLGRIPLLLEMFPDAKFIFIHRNPYKVIESLYHFILSVFPGVQLQDVPSDFSREQVVMLYRKLMDRYFIDRGLIPQDNLFEVSLDQFLCDIQGNLKTIYNQFSLGDFNRIVPHIEKYLAQNPSPDRKPYPPEQETIDLVDKYAAGIMQQLGYSPTGYESPVTGKTSLVAGV